ncbi:hypothetical protein [Porphyrobacter sp. AAP82]|uniref:hypothetical protein n=1 Tax=Porphyrobacter sp. AAP82 TaxID=1248917 RepID=UPI0012DE25D9|nr:hypothetical protein [Porphyrobacter sp. AAP82]
MNNIPTWLALLGFAAPLIALAGSAVALVIRQYYEAKQRQRDEFFALLDRFDNPNTGIFCRLAATYRLREFKEDRDFLLRFLELQQKNVEGGKDAVALLVGEMKLTCRALRGEEFE